MRNFKTKINKQKINFYSKCVRLLRSDVIPNHRTALVGQSGCQHKCGRCYS